MSIPVHKNRGLIHVEISTKIEVNRFVVYIIYYYNIIIPVTGTRYTEEFPY